MSQSFSEPPVETRTWIDLLGWRARQQPDRRAYTYLIDGETEGTDLTYAELDQKARAIGAVLQCSVAPGERALLLYSPGLEFIAAFFGCLYSGVIAVPVYPPDPTRPNRTLPETSAIVNDAKPLVALSTSAILSKTEHLFARTTEFHRIHWLATDSLDRDPTVGDSFRICKGGIWLHPALEDVEEAQEPI